MTDRSSSSGKDFNRRLRAHTKSRRGCGNCKLRRVKCDESKPGCKACIAYGVSCNYNCKTSDLQLSVDGASNIEILHKFRFTPIQATIPGTITSSSRQLSTGFTFENQDLELLKKFEARTVLTIGTGKSLNLDQKGLFDVACSHPSLMHAVLTLTLMHDRYLSSAPNTRLSTTEAFHWYQATALFNKKLLEPIKPSERDVLWATAALLGTIVFYYIEAETPEEAWPLKPSSPLDLNWLWMSVGKKAIFTDTKYSVFLVPVPDHTKSWPGLEALPPGFTNLCCLDDTSTDESNPYHAAALGLARSLELNLQSTILNFMDFIGHMSPEYKELVELKDPRALLILAYWYAKVCQHQRWWIWRRAALECQAICIYLGRYHGDETDIQQLLQYPRMLVGNSAR